MASFPSRRFLNFVASRVDHARRSQRRRQSSPPIASEQLEQRRLMAADLYNTTSFDYPPPV